MAQQELSASLARFVPAHPIAGTEHSGPEAAFDTLYLDRRVVLAPLPQTDPAALALVPEALRSRLVIAQQCRPEDIEAARAAYETLGVGSYDLSSFFTDVPARLDGAHFHEDTVLAALRSAGNMIVLTNLLSVMLGLAVVFALLSFAYHAGPHIETEWAE